MEWKKVASVNGMGESSLVQSKAGLRKEKEKNGLE